MDATGMVLAAAVAFVGSHFVMSHPLRGGLVRVMGEGGFLLVYTLVSFVTLGWLVYAYIAAPAAAPLWPVGEVLWAIVSAVMLVASVLFVGSLIGNPAFPHPTGNTTMPGEARGVFAVTRHPMMWGFGLWGLCHIAVFPDPSNVILAGSIVVLALVGAALQDRKKERLQPDIWRAWEAKTSYWPFAAIAAGRARFGGFRPHDWAGGLLLWLIASWAHLPLAGWGAGIWRWL
ncbi:NnrU family protein [Hephaestia sp. GCM10023244]|uniref:NnrU family protein n=1 Tax=unclassified Hephaestia TaxID=2631281 RepID=UPI0020778B4C|nr:NnrU family protein [Hephaestia sp. MAHUQ-44]MCM8729755.1 NnrU family protein [Hephaestia sp. MAHUQ-44]